MLTGIRISNATVRKEETPTDLLLGCHQRIRHFTAMSRRLAGDTAAPLEQVADAAAAIYRYFSEALPLHEADENVSIDPRLHTASAAVAATHASEEMVRQHRQINVVLAQLLPLWDALCREPEQLPRFASRLLQLGDEIQSLWDVHLKLEEENVFPAMERYLSTSEIAEILREMRERRRQEPDLGTFEMA